MKKSLLDVLFASDKRKNVLLFLQDGPKEMDFLLSSLETTRQALLPQIRILEDHHLVIQLDDSYELTAIGEIIVDEMRPLLDTLEVFDNNVEYWGNRNLDFIPSHLLERTRELGKCNVRKPHPTDICALDKKTLEDAYNSRNHYAICAYYHAGMPEVFSKTIRNGVDTYFIVTQDVMDKILTENHDDFAEFTRNKLFHMFVYPEELGFISFVCTDYGVLMRMIDISGNPDYVRVEFAAPEALEWGKDLFEHFMKCSKPITEI